MISNINSKAPKKLPHKQTQVFIFSFNRGPLLENCVQSTLSCIPNAAITIYDDNSTNKQTVRTLRRAKGFGVRVIRPKKVHYEDYSKPRGGLYDNMRDVIENHIDPNTFDYVLFVQDDMQFVRPLQSADFECIEDVFSENENLLFLYPVFNRGPSEPTAHRLIPSRNSFAFAREKDYEYGGFSAVFLARCDRLSQCRWSLPNNEEETSQLAQEHHGSMYEYPLPFLAYLPAPRSYRFKRTTLAVRIWDQLYTGCFPISYLKESDVEKMKRLFPQKAATAEEFLESPTFGAHPWPVFRHENSPLWLRILDRIELLGNRVFRRLLKLRKSYSYRNK